ncbi:MAG: transglutaminase-like domain-containing protein [Geothrix sp.]|nr:transglutaminase-like domain-containing protein [Geothrix sp.]
MRASPLFPLVLAGLTLLGQEGPPRTFRQWLGGQEVGGASLEVRQEGSVREIRSREWMVLSRMGLEIRQDLNQTARKAPEGGLTFTWRLQLSSEPFEGRAEWSPRDPGVLSIQPTHGPAVRKEVPPEALLWPEDLETRLKEAARTGRPLQAVTFSFPVQQWSTLHLEPQGAAPLPGFPDAVRYTGQERQGPTSTPVEVWISPTAGELRHRAELGGLVVLTQRSELPVPAPGTEPIQGFFERTLQKLPPHPFQPWLADLTLRAVGAAPDLPEDAQQIRLPEGRWRLRRPAPPTTIEAAQPPVTGLPGPGEARYLAPSPLVPFQDRAFDGLIRRMALPPGLPRWELARRVNAFVFEWIADKDFSVGFASALEVCRQPRGDCTEHGVLAVALLRRLGVPARGVTGWVGLGELLGLHFWVEVRLKDRWVSLDPTFDQAPASALRIKLGDTDLADLGSVGWEGAALAFSGLRWVPEREGADPWGGALLVRGDQITGPGGILLRLPGGRWDLQGGVLHLRAPRGGPWRVQAVTRPGEDQLKGARRLAGARSLRQGWWNPASRQLWMELGEGRWLQVEAVSEGEAFDLLDQLMVPASSS